MAAVIGSRDNFNRDPSKMPRWNANAEQTIAITGTSPRSSNSSADFFTQYFTSYIDTPSVANTARTIYTVSGKGGWLITACGSRASSGGMTTTFVVTVDGVAHTVLVGGANNATARGWIGPVGGSLALANNSYWGQIDMKTAYTRAVQNSGGNKDNTTWNFTGDGNVATENTTHYVFPSNLLAPFYHPSSVVRFENSLTVTVSTSLANSSTYQENAGALVRLDS